MNYNFQVTYRRGILLLASDMVNHHSEIPARALVSEDRATGHTLIEAIGIEIPAHEIEATQAANPTRRYVWKDPFATESLAPPLAAQVLRYHQWRVFGPQDSLYKQLRYLLRLDRCNIVLRLANFDELSSDQVRGLSRALKHVGFFNSVVVKPIELDRA